MLKRWIKPVPGLLLSLGILGLLWPLAVVGADRDGLDRERSWERIAMIRAMKMTEALKLDRETAAKMAVIDAGYKDKKKKLGRDFHEDLRLLRQAAREPGTPEKDLRVLLQRLKQNKKDMDELAQKQLDEEMALLTTEQQARYVLFTIDFRREMETLLHDSRRPVPPEKQP